MAFGDDEAVECREDYSHEGGSSSKKRKHREGSISNQFGMGQTLSLPRQPDLPEFNLTSARRPSQDSESAKDDEANSSQEWQTVDYGGARKKAKKIPKANSSNYPAIEFGKDARLQSQIKISDLQNLVLYILADGTSPQFVSVRHRPQIRKVVVLMVPGLEKAMFDNKPLEDDKRREAGDRHYRDRNYTSPDDYYPNRLKPDKLPSCLKPFADMFELLWPVKTPGDDKYGKMYSPLHAMLTAPLSKGKEEKKQKGVKQAREPQGWKNTRTRITEFIHMPEELLENDYVLHPASYDNDLDKLALKEQRRSSETSQDHGWVDSQVNLFDDGSVPENEIESGSITAGREVLAMDCEMCMTGEKEFSLTRISVVGWDGSVVLDELVKPDKPITDFLTMYSGITEKLLAPVTTTLQDIQKRLLEILHPRTILLGHSLNSDLSALKITHPFIIDTALLYPHPRGPPLKSSLKYLAQKYLNREIQKGHGTTGPGAGHDSIEDARTCLDLVKQKCEKGKEWGTNDSAGENIFKRVARTGVRYKNQTGSAIPNPLSGKSSAAVDWGNPKKGPGGAATFAIGCQSDEEVAEGVIRAVKGDPDGAEIPGGGVDFVWGRLRELEALKGWWNNNKLTNSETAEKEETLAVDTGIEMNDPATAKLFKHTTTEAASPALISPLFVSATSSLPPPTNIDFNTSLTTATASLSQRIAKIHSALPPCTAFIIYSGSGDPREMSRLQQMQIQFKREYKIKKWDELSVKWTDVEEQALKRALRVARDGVGFIGMK